MKYSHKTNLWTWAALFVKQALRLRNPRKRRSPSEEENWDADQSVYIWQIQWSFYRRYVF